MQRFNLDNKVVIVTGGGGLLGGKFCESLFEAGASLVIADADLDAALAVSEKISQKSTRRILVSHCDVSSPTSVGQLIENVVERFDHIDILINNAATKTNDLNEFFAPFDKYSLETWREVLSVNIDGMFLMAQAVGQHMIEKSIHGSIIQTSSIYGILAPDQRIYEGSLHNGIPINTPAVYSVSKAGVNALTIYLASYWGRFGIRVNTLTPGGIESGQNDIFVQKYSERVPLNRMGQSFELTGALLFLASDESSYITGQNIVVDGGLSIW